MYTECQRKVFQSYVTSFFKHPTSFKFGAKSTNLREKYLKWPELGTAQYKPVFLSLSEYKHKTKLLYINIYFKSPTFDEITQDARTNFVTKISALGGTLGLFAGFSLFSGVEIAYFLATTGYQLGAKAI